MLLARVPRASTRFILSHSLTLQSHHLSSALMATTVLSLVRTIRCPKNQYFAWKVPVVIQKFKGIKTGRGGVYLQLGTQNIRHCRMQRWQPSKCLISAPQSSGRQLPAEGLLAIAHLLMPSSLVLVLDCKSYKSAGIQVILHTHAFAHSCKCFFSESHSDHHKLLQDREK